MTGSPARSRWWQVRPLAAVTLVLTAWVVAPAAKATPATRANLLLFNFSLGFHHISIPHGTEVLTDALVRDGFHVTVSGDPKDLTPTRLANTDAVIWLSTTGNGAAPFSPAQRHAFEGWMRCGGGNVGIHAVAGPLFTGWPAWHRMWGSTEGGEPLTETSVADDDTKRYEGWGQFDVTVKVDDHSSPATAPWHGLTTFNARDEWYHWSGDPSKVVPDFHQLLGFDGFTDPRTAAQFSGSYWFDMPVAWTGSFAHTNRDFYTNLGHSTTIWDDPAYVDHVVGGTEWVTKVQPNARCLARRGMPGRTPRARRPAPYRGSATTLKPAATAVPRADCALAAQATFGAAAAGADPSAPWRGGLWGGLGGCNGQPDAECSLDASPGGPYAGGCTDPAHATAGVEAGEYYVDPRTDVRYREPALTGSGPCAGGTFTGIVFVTWRDHQMSILSVSSTGGLVSGSVLRTVTLEPLPHQRDHTGRLTLRSTEFAGGTVSGVLSSADCAEPGVPTGGYAPSGDAVAGGLNITA